MFQGIPFRSGKHTHTHSHFILLLYNVCDSPNCQNAGRLNMPPSLSQCELFLNTKQSPVPGTQLHPFETQWMFSRGPVLYVYDSPPSSCGNLTRCHCKKKHMKCSVAHQLRKPSVPSCHVTCTVTAKTRNVPGNVTSPTLMVLHPFRPSTATNTGLFLPPAVA